MDQILESAYVKDPEKWQEVANLQGGLEICDSETGWPIFTLEPDEIQHY